MTAATAVTVAGVGATSSWLPSIETPNVPVLKPPACAPITVLDRPP
jgi:hypothetical protein